jgi:hypothetical protein
MRTRSFALAVAGLLATSPGAGACTPNRASIEADGPIGQAPATRGVNGSAAAPGQGADPSGPFVVATDGQRFVYGGAPGGAPTQEQASTAAVKASGAYDLRCTVELKVELLPYDHTIVDGCGQRAVYMWSDRRLFLVGIVPVRPPPPSPAPT